VARRDVQREASGEARREVLLLSEDVREVSRAQFGFGAASASLLLTLTVTEPAGILAGFGAHPAGVSAMFTVVEAEPAPLADEDVLDVPQAPATIAIRTSAGTAANRRRSLAIPATRLRKVALFMLLCLP
jgi:hypothetical protein